MKVLVTGNRGFLASHLTQKLKERPEITHIVGVNREYGHTIEFIDESERWNEIYCMLDSEAYVHTLFKRYSPDVIFHFAAEQGKSPDSYQRNVLSTLHLLKYCPPKCRFVYASSSTVYGDLGQCRWCQETDVTMPTNLYGASKLAGESLLSAYMNNEKEIQGLILRFCAVVGKGAKHGLLPDLMKKAKSDSTTMEVLGDAPGSQKPYLHVEDAVDATLFLFDKNVSGIFNAIPYTDMTVEEVAGAVINHYQIKKELRWLGPKSTPVGDNMLVRMDDRKLATLGWCPKYPTSEESIKATLCAF